jgi:23S rRNA pseudouridine2605 synthase
VLARLGHKVVRLVRIAIGPVRLGELPRGASRKLTEKEIASLRRASLRPRRNRESKIDD